MNNGIGIGIKKVETRLFSARKMRMLENKSCVTGRDNVMLVFLIILLRHVCEIGFF
jgi:hypothetical protein